MTVSTTTDAVLTQDGPVIGVQDLTIDATGDINTEDFFDTSLLMSIFAERRASESEVPESRFRRGWIGNESNVDGFEDGSKVWLFEQSRITRDTLNGISTAAEEGLKWLVDDAIAISVSTSTSINANGVVVLSIVIERPNSKVEKRFFELWENTGISGRLPIQVVPDFRITETGDFRITETGDRRIV